MTRNAGRGTRYAMLALTIAAACAREKPASDSAGARADSVSQPAATAGSQTAPADASPAARSPGSGKSVDAKTSAKVADTSARTGTTGTTGPKILGRDSLVKGPVVGIPSIVDTAKRRPPV